MSEQTCRERIVLEHAAKGADWTSSAKLVKAALKQRAIQDLIEPDIPFERQPLAADLIYRLCHQHPPRQLLLCLLFVH